MKEPGHGINRRFVLAFALAFCLASSAQTDWPHLRGVNYDAVSAETGLADTWPATGPPRLWVSELGQGHSGFVVAEGKLFTQRQTIGGQYVVSLDIDSGHTLWETRYDTTWQHQGAYPGPYATPTYYRGKIYYSSPTGLVGCLDAKTGDPLWSFNVRERFQGKGNKFGYAATPLVEDGRVIVPVGGPSASLVALHADDGKILWTTGSDGASYCSAMAITFEGRRCIVGFLENALLLVEASTGTLLCRQQFSAGYDEHSAWPLYREPHLVLTSPFRVPARCLQLQAGENGSIVCSTVWTSKELCNDVVSSVLYHDHVYGFDLKQNQASGHRPSRGSFKCLEWSTGKLSWSTDQVGQAALVAADGKLLLLTDEGTLILARADPSAYQELARTQLFEDEICWTPPMLWQGRLFVRSPSRAVCLFVGRPENLPAGVAILPAQTTSSFWRFDFRWLASREREFPNDSPSLQEMAEWFAACVILIFGGAAVVTGLLYLLAKLFAGWRLPCSPVFFAAAFALGLLGPNLFTALLDRFLFTWPASLYAAFHGTVAVCWWAEQHPKSRQARWLARLAMIGFVLVGYAFYLMCKAIGMYIGWSFLFGFMIGLPFTILAVRAAAKQQPLVIRGAWTILGFSAFFWSGQGLLVWKSAGGE